MQVSRRGFMRVLGGTAVFAAAAGVGLTQCDRMPGAAIAGWEGPGAETEPRRRALSYALLAPNPHNRQQWIADLKTPDAVALYVDTSRMLPMSDPPGRQVVIGCGCFLETLVLAAAAEGWRAEPEPWPDGVDEADLGARPFARVRFSPMEKSDPDGLAAQILKRRTFRVDYEAGRALAAADAEALRASHRDGDIALSLTSDPAQVAALRDIGMRAFRIETDTDRIYQETVNVMRVGADAIAAHRDGLLLHGPLIWWADQFGLLTPEAQMKKGGTARETARGFIDSAAATTSTFGWIATAANTRQMQLRAGRAYVRLNLAAVKQSAALAPWSQVLQEYPEMAALQKEFRGVVGAAENETVQMFFRLGYGEPPEPMPRRALDDIIRA